VKFSIQRLAPYFLVLVFLTPILFVIGCGSSDSSNVSAPNQNSPTVQIQGVAPAGTPGGGAVVLQGAPKGLAERALSLISRPARAQAGDVVLASFLATAFDSRGQAIQTVTTNARGEANFSGLPAGTYRVLFFETNFPTTFIQTFVTVQQGVPIAARADARTSAAVLVVLNIARGLNVSNVDAPALFRAAQNDPNFPNLVNILTGLLRSGQPNFNQGTGGTLNPQLEAAVVQVARAVAGGTSTGGTSTGGTSTGGTSTGGTSTGGTSTGGTSTGGTSTGGTSTGGTSTGGTSTGGTSTGGTSTGGTSTGGTSTGGTSTGGGGGGGGITNGSFSDGLNGWTPQIVNSVTVGGTFPQFLLSTTNCVGRGSNPYFALDIPHGADGYLEQTFTVPGGHTRLTYLVWGGLDPVLGRVEIFDQANTQMLGQDVFGPVATNAVSGCVPGATAESRSLAVTPGQVIRVRLGGSSTAASTNSAFIRFDDVTTAP
jgi:hypothetical protein